MINWDNFYVFAAVSICLWLAGAVFALRSSSKSKVAIGFTSGGIIILGVFIAGLWIFLQRPPLRTMGETRLWYSFFMGIAGLLTYIRWKYRWILSFSTLLSTVFVIINLMKPEIHEVIDACAAKCMVYPACDRIYVLLLRSGMCFHHRPDRTVPS